MNMHYTRTAMQLELVDEAYDWARVPHEHRAYSTAMGDAPLYSMVHFIKFGTYTPKVVWEAYTPLQIYFAWLTAKCIKFRSIDALPHLTEKEIDAIPYRLHRLASWAGVVADCRVSPLTDGPPGSLRLMATMRNQVRQQRDIRKLYDALIVPRIQLTHLLGQGGRRSIGPLQHQITCHVSREYKLPQHQSNQLFVALGIWLPEFEDESLDVLNIVLTRFHADGQDFEIEIQRFDAQAPNLLDQSPSVQYAVAPCRLTSFRHIYILQFSTSRSLLRDRKNILSPMFHERFGTTSGCCLPIKMVDSEAGEEPTIYLDNYGVRYVGVYQTEPQPQPQPQLQPAQEPTQEPTQRLVVSVDKDHDICVPDISPVRITRRRKYYEFITV